MNFEYRVFNGATQNIDVQGMLDPKNAHQDSTATVQKEEMGRGRSSALTLGRVLRRKFSKHRLILYDVVVN